MFDYDINTREHHTGKDGEQSFSDWKRKMHINAEDFPFKLKTGKTDKRGFQLWMNVVSWGFYQGSDWRFYVFITYRSSDQKMTVAYHFDVDDSGFPVGNPRKHQWSN